MSRSTQLSPEAIVLTWLVVIPIFFGLAIYVGMYALVIGLIYLVFDLYFGAIGRLLKNSPALRDPVWGRVIATAASAVLVISVVLVIQLIATR